MNSKTEKLFQTFLCERDVFKFRDKQLAATNQLVHCPLEGSAPFPFFPLARVVASTFFLAQARHYMRRGPLAERCTWFTSASRQLD